MLKGKALRRVMASKDSYRAFEDVALIVDETVLITPELAMEMLKKNKNNRPINWARVDEYAKIMLAGGWRLHSQGIVIDENGNLLTGQKRLLAVSRSGVSCWFRVSRGCPADTANLLDRGAPQSSRDLASRSTERKHSATEANIARAVCIIRGALKPGTDKIAETMAELDVMLSVLTEESKGTKKTRGVLMVLAAMAANRAIGEKGAKSLIPHLQFLADKLQSRYGVVPLDNVWGRGTNFTLALEMAVRVLSDFVVSGKD